MNNDIHTIYYNNFGFAFYWKRYAVEEFRKIQLIFKNTGLFLSETELIQFAINIQDSLESSDSCHDCVNDSKLLLLEAPTPLVSFAMTQEELKNMEDLISGTLFLLDLNEILKQKNIHEI